MLHIFQEELQKQFRDKKQQVGSNEHYHFFIVQNRGLPWLIFINAFGFGTVSSRVHLLVWWLPVISGKENIQFPVVT